MVIGPLRSYQDAYVAACGIPFSGRELGVQHERECQACKTAIEVMDQQRELSVIPKMREKKRMSKRLRKLLLCQKYIAFCIDRELGI